MNTVSRVLSRYVSWPSWQVVQDRPVNFEFELQSLVSGLSRYSTATTKTPLTLKQPITWTKDVKLTKLVESKEDFKHVLKLLPEEIVPEPPKHDSYPTPSGWRPPNYEKSKNLPYAVLRTRFHNYPIYVMEREGGSRKLVRIKYIQGNIWVSQLPFVVALASSIPFTDFPAIVVRQGSERVHRGPVVQESEPEDQHLQSGQRGPASSRCQGPLPGSHLPVSHRMRFLNTTTTNPLTWINPN